MAEVLYTEFILLGPGSLGVVPCWHCLASSRPLRSRRTSGFFVELVHWARTLFATVTDPSFFEIAFCACKAIEEREVAGTKTDQEPVVREDHVSV